MGKHLKNTTAHGYELMVMNPETYALRRAVIDVIYQAKKHFNLPRVEVRIVEDTTCKGHILGYAYLGKNIIHIRKDIAQNDKNRLVYVVLHELCHAIFGVGHRESCPLMGTYIKDGTCEGILWATFTKYYRAWERLTDEG